MAAPNPAVAADHFVEDDVVGVNATPNELVAAMANLICGVVPSVVEILHAIPDNVMDVGARNVIVAVLNQRSAQAHLIREHAVAHEARASHEHVIPLITALPDIPVAQQVNNVPEARTYRLQDFGGNKDDKISCLNWLARIMHLATQQNLSHAATLSLLERHTMGSAAQVVSDSIRAGGSLEECVRTLEVRYAGLQHPESARVSVNAIKREDNEKVGELADRIKQLAFMATRLTRPHDEQMMKENDLASTNLQRCLSPAMRTAIAERVRQRNIEGALPYTYTALTAEIEDLEKRNKALGKLKFDQDAVAEAVKKAEQVTTSSDNVTEPETDTIRLMKEANSVQAKGFENMISYMKQMRPYERSDKSRERNKSPGGRPDQKDQKKDNKYRYASKDRKDRPRSNSRDNKNRNYQDRSSRKDSPWPKDPPNWNREGSQTSRASSGTRSFRSDSNRRIDFSTLNITRTECAKCGLENHFMNSQYCPLKGKPLTSSPCANCMKGGHLPAYCLRSAKN